MDKDADARIKERIKKLAEKVAGLLGDTEEKVRAKLDNPRYMSILTREARNQGFDLKDDAHRGYIRREVKQLIKNLIRTPKWQREQREKPLLSPVSLNPGGRRHIDYTLPPGDRE